MSLKVPSSRGFERATPLITAPTWGVSFSALIADGVMLGLLWLRGVLCLSPDLFNGRVARHHWMISVACWSRDGGTVSPRAFAVFRLMIISNFDGCST